MAILVVHKKRLRKWLIMPLKYLFLSVKGTSNEKFCFFHALISAVITYPLPVTARLLLTVLFQARGVEGRREEWRSAFGTAGSGLGTPPSLRDALLQSSTPSRCTDPPPQQWNVLNSSTSSHFSPMWLWVRLSSSILLHNWVGDYFDWK